MIVPPFGHHSIGQVNQTSIPGTAPQAGILRFVRYFITAVYLYLCFGHYSAAALASEPQKGVPTITDADVQCQRGVWKYGNVHNNLTMLVVASVMGFL